MARPSRWTAGLQLLLLALALLVCAPFSCSSAKPESGLQLTFYMESLCPYCKAFTLTGLTRLFQSGASDLVNVTLVPWGNARYNETDGRWKCQHGPLECVYNAVLSCVIDKHPKQDDWFPYLSCLEANLGKGGEQEWSREVHERCADDAGVDADATWQCAWGPEGRELQLRARALTDALDPPHTGVPWVTLTGKGGDAQGVPLFDVEDYVRTLVCAAYSGPNSLPTDCYKEETPESPPYARFRAGGKRRSPRDWSQGGNAAQPGSTVAAA